MARSYTKGQDALPDKKTKIELEPAWNRDKEAAWSKTRLNGTSGVLGNGSLCGILDPNL